MDPRTCPGEPVGEFGVYVHVPFCAVRCDYCDFATWTDRSHLADAYVEACVADIARRALPRATSVFFGGGTPSLLDGRSLARILEAIRRVPGAEVTVECNPDSVDDRKLEHYADAGVNRLSFGVQSIRSHVLARLGRTHDPDNVAWVVARARAAGFTNLNIDVIYGTPGETLADWSATLDGVLALEPTHVSAYALTVEPGTPLSRAVAAGVRAAPDPDDQAAKYEMADDRLAGAGYSWYEISNWARPGCECRHNLLYWTQGEYAGIGCAAHGHTVAADGATARRWWNVRTPDLYLERVAAGRPVEAGGEDLDAFARDTERVVLGLRTTLGVKLELLQADALVVNDLREAGLLDLRGGRAVLSRRGRLLASDVVVRILARREAACSSASAVPGAPFAPPGTR